MASKTVSYHGKATVNGQPALMMNFVGFATVYIAAQGTLYSPSHPVRGKPYRFLRLEYCQAATATTGLECRSMSSWGCGPFDNDTAADFAADLDEAPEPARLGMLHTALTAVDTGGDYVDGARAEVALAAVALIARDLNGGAEFQSQHYGPAGHLPPIPKNLISLAVDVVDCLLNGENDVKRYWSESSEGDNWFAAMRRLRVVLDGDPSSNMDPLWPQ